MSGQLHGLEAVAHRTEIDQGRPHETPTLVAAVDDAALVHGDEGAQLVGEAEPILVPQAPDIHALGRGRWVVMRDPRVERQPLGTLNRLGRDPGERGDETGVGQPFLCSCLQHLLAGVR